MSDEMTKIFLAVMFALSGILPVIGFGRLLFRAAIDLSVARALAEERGTKVARMVDTDTANADITATPKKVRNDLIWDILLVGIGLGLGAVASIWSLCL